MSKTRGSVVIGLSGGVDSAVAALLLQRDEYDVKAVFMKNWSEDDFGGPCPWAEDQSSAQAVAKHLRIPLETWNFEPEYRERVFAAMIHDYQQGRTPNPDILCNREIKFDLFLKRALTHAPLVATGHYAQTKDGHLFRAADESKDQSYFLAAVPGVALQHVLFPIGHLQKTEVRELAKLAGLPNWDRLDSVGICFVGEKKMKEFLSKYITASPGPITLPDGTVVGQHDGLPYYTIGQRHGFGPKLDQKKVAAAVGAGQPLFVTDKKTTDNTLVVASTKTKTDIERKDFFLETADWVMGQPKFPIALTAKLRYRAADIPVTLSNEAGRILVTCQTPQRAITPGQFAVFYSGDECLGAGQIASH